MPGSSRRAGQTEASGRPARARARCKPAAGRHEPGRQSTESSRGLTPFLSASSSTTARALAATRRLNPQLAPVVGAAVRLLGNHYDSPRTPMAGDDVDLPAAVAGVRGAGDVSGDPGVVEVGETPGGRVSPRLETAVPECGSCRAHCPHRRPSSSLRRASRSSLHCRRGRFLGVPAPVPQQWCAPLAAPTGCSCAKWFQMSTPPTPRATAATSPSKAAVRARLRESPRASCQPRLPGGARRGTEVSPPGCPRRSRTSARSPERRSSGSRSRSDDHFPAHSLERPDELR